VTTRQHVYLSDHRIDRETRDYEDRPASIVWSVSDHSNLTPARDGPLSTNACRVEQSSMFERSKARVTELYIYIYCLTGTLPRLRLSDLIGKREEAKSAKMIPEVLRRFDVSCRGIVVRVSTSGFVMAANPFLSS